MMKAVAATVEALNQEQIAILEQGSISVNVEGQDCTIERTDVEIISEDMPGWSVANEGTLTVALDINITEELHTEGVAREVVKRIQAYRKESGFEITDRIHIVMEHNASIEKAVNDYKEFICSQVLAESFLFSSTLESETMFDFDDAQVKVSITRNTN